MSVVCLALFLGMIAGYFAWLPKSLEKYIGYLSWGGLFIILLSMGIKIGSNREILGQLGALGIKAFVLSGFSVLFSVLFLWLVEKKVLYKGGH